MKITPAFLTINYQSGRCGPYPISAIVVHVTEGDERSVRAWFRDPAAKVSSHYMVTKTGEIVQFVHEEDTAWANGRVDHPTAKLVMERPDANPNWWTISIEHEGDGKHELTDAQRISSLWLIRDIAKRRRIPITRRFILGHHEIFSLKSCPGAISVDRLVQEAAARQDFSDVTGGSSSTAPS
jgi:N-acetylmuramoyl-L-alanine amidase